MIATIFAAGAALATVVLTVVLRVAGVVVGRER